ncbi:MAG: hypothetical protein ABW133_11310 [Polyangiaceae bacterium]
MGRPDVTYVIFNQEPRGAPPFEKLAANASRFFNSKLELTRREGDVIVFRLVTTRPAISAEFRLGCRAPTRDDLMRAREAEARGRAAGMSALAEKCRAVWELEAAESESPAEIAYLTLAAICASVGLGPVMPPDGSTLFGVRGAIERRDRAVG